MDVGICWQSSAIIITSLRYFDNSELSPDYTCTYEDFDIELKKIHYFIME
jgi:hypothetical protein